MKKTISWLFTLVCIFSIVATPALANESHDAIIPINENSYIVISTQISPMRATNTTSGTRTYTYVDEGATKWQASLTGTFTYNGNSSSCTAADCSVTIYDNAWCVVSKTATHSGNRALATITMGYKTLGVIVSKGDYQIAISCDKNGNLS